MSEANKRKLQGTVVSAMNAKTIVVQVDRRVTHPLYKKVVTKSAKFHAHDAQDKCKIGDIVIIQESKPFSKMKTWELVSVVEQAS
jgi:small subunit ribosomal protein S17